MTTGQLTPEAKDALGEVYVFLLRKRRERLARKTHEMVVNEPQMLASATTILDAKNIQQEENKLLRLNQAVNNNET